MSKLTEYPIKELIFMTIGLRVPKNAPTEDIISGRDYWLKNDRVRELDWAWSWFQNPRSAWSTVQHRG
ncbi:MAG: hypothetical protein GY850_41350 [bacterium]|nr:hypothetical protein [bacterium]